MLFLLFLLLIVAVGGCLTLLVVLIREWATSQQLRSDAEQFGVEATRLRTEVARLSPWSGVADAAAKAAALIAGGREALTQAESDARILRESADAAYRQRVEAAASDASRTLVAAKSQAATIVQEAMSNLATAVESAAEAKRDIERCTRAAIAMKNRIDGYGDEYLVPAASLLDDLADEFSHADAGAKLKQARTTSKVIVKDQRAAACSYVEANRKEAAIRFVLDAFNGKVDSILARVRYDNFGKLNEELDDAFGIVNHYGSAFRDAHISAEYLEARRAELRCASVAHELKRQDAEQQRQIRDQMREEEKVRRELERAIKESAKEEDVLRAALAKAQAQAEAASDSQRAKYESQLTELTARLHEAEERGQRAISMAQQTKRGFVYIISNVGSFGEDVYKIGLTRRLDPMDRIWELSDASVPFDFDVHAMILSDDAPSLEIRLHKHLLINQINKVNHRKEFFRASIAELRGEIETIGIDAQWTLRAEAREYHETVAIERRIAADPQAREAWINRQLKLDPVELKQLVSVGEGEELD